MKTTTDIIARGLALILLAVLTTTTAFAQLRGQGTAEEPFLINNADDWKTFTDNINMNIGNESYYLLVNDINLGTSEEPISTVVGKSKTITFNGTFDGGNHTINMYMTRKNDFAAPFGVTDGATIKNLTVEGTIITDHKFAGGFVGYAYNSNNSTTSLINCISRVHIHCDSIHEHINVNGQVVNSGSRPYDCTHGGLVGQNESGYLSFVNCAFEGSIVDSKEVKTANKCTGFVAWVNKGVSYSNCIMAGTIDVKPNDGNGLKNSMATFHRCANGVSAKFDKNNPSYYINDYTFPGLTIQGTAALTEIPENQLAKIYTVGSTDYYIPGVCIDGYSVTFCSENLVEGTDYLINIITSEKGNKLTITGINSYAGSYVEDITASVSKDITIWNDVNKTGWQAISSPINGQSFEGVTSLTGSVRHNIYRYDEEKRQWQEYRNAANLYTSFENGRGYIYRTEDASGSITFNGSSFNSGNVDYSLSYNEKGDNLNGISLIGNPYNHPIYKGVAISNEKLASGYCILDIDGTVHFKDDSNVIPVGTAIFVQATEAGKLTMTDTDASSKGRATNSDIWFTVENNEFNDVARVQFGEGRGFNKMPHYNEDAPMLYIIQNDANFASANISESDDIIGLGFEAKKMGKFTLSVKANGSFDYMHLIDKVTGADVDLLAEKEYSFIGTGSDDADRFIVKLSENAGNASVESDIFAWQNGNDIIVTGNGELQIFDVTGRMISTRCVNGVENIRVNAQDVIILRLIGDETKTQKIVVR